MSPDVVLATLARLGGRVERIYIVGCQPASLDEGMGLTPAVAAAVDGAVELCLSTRGRNRRNPQERGHANDPSSRSRRCCSPPWPGW